MNQARPAVEGGSEAFRLEDDMVPTAAIRRPALLLALRVAGTLCACCGAKPPAPAGTSNERDSSTE